MTGLEPVNPLLAKQVLSQLSYTPMSPCLVFTKTFKIEQRIDFFKSFYLIPYVVSLNFTRRDFFLTKFELFELTSSDLTHVSLERR